MTNTKSIEILAPCGSYDILIAAIHAGADACYIGGNKFGARAYATNLEEDSIIRAIDYAHLHDTKLYLTVNTLLKNNEIKELYNYIAPYYEAGLDAVIVQDLGVFSIIKNNFPELPIHCSTQMNITSLHSARLMKEMGATRMVAAREMSLKEIEHIKKNLDMEIEAFVHGALCYSYSGQCLMSSLAGGRSGNRGRCAQPCRKCYDGEYILSMKDMCALENIPAIIKAGIDSLKIEGRMKNEYYVASAVDAYKTIVTDCVENNFTIDKAKKLKDKLASIYNRGGFCDGYYFIHNGPEMISSERPNNQGVYMGKLLLAEAGKIKVKLARDLHKQDVLEVKLKDGSSMDITTGISGRKGEIVFINAPKSRDIFINQHIYRTRCNSLIEDIKNNIIDKVPKHSVNAHFYAKVGEPIKLTLNYKNYEISVDSEQNVEASLNQKPDLEMIKSKLTMTGNTEFTIDNVIFDVDSKGFIPIGLIKKLRRDAIDCLRDEITASFRRKLERSKDEFTNNRQNNSKATLKPEVEGLHISVSTIQQLQEILKYKVNNVYMSIKLYNTAISLGILNKQPKDIKIYIELPYIIHSDFDIIAYVPPEVSGVYVRNIDGYSCILDNIAYFKDKHIILGASLYAYNDAAISFLDNSNYNITFELPRELNIKEISKLTKADTQLIIYEHQQVMLSAQCVVKNTDGCNNSNAIKKITDDMGNSFYAWAKCDECCNIIYNGIPLDVIDKLEGDMLCEIVPNSLKLKFTIEKNDEVIRVMDKFMAYSNMDAHQVNNIRNKRTTGHYYRGVE